MARTYKRDSNGRFAGGGGGSSGGGSKRPAAKTVSRGVNRLTRDNAGKITSVGGTGATARGGRLRTAAGNKRAMQTAKVSGSRAKGTMKGKVKRDPGAMSKVGQGKAAATPSKKRVLVRMDARPQNLFSRTTKKSDGYGTDAKANVANARKQIEKAGATSALKSNKRSSTVASVDLRTPKQVDINASHTAWRNPGKNMIENRRKNQFSTSSPGHYVAHELGHVRYPSDKMVGSWDVQLRGKGQVYADLDKVLSAKRMARRVSKYAMTEPAEFVAETRAARSLGKKYDSKVMGLYRNVTGTNVPSLKSQQQKKNASSGYVSPRAKPKSKPATAAPKPAATPKPAAKLPKEQRLARATATASRIAKKRKQAADETGAAFAERRRISGRASSKARSSAFAKEAAAGKQSASALRSFQRADNRESNLIASLGRERQSARTAAPKPAAAATAKPSARKADLSPSAFKRRAEVADVRARFAESNAQGLDRANPKNRKAFNRADSMRNAANSYSSILKRSQSSEFSPAQIFNSRQKTSTNPKQTPSEKAAITRANNKMKTFEKNVKAQERARRFR